MSLKDKIIELISMYRNAASESKRRAAIFDKQQDYGTAADLKKEADVLIGVIDDLKIALKLKADK